MDVTRERIGSVIGGGTVAAALAFFALTHEPVAPAQPEQAALNIPTIEQMCASLGASDGQALMECQALESSAGEYVIAWMGLNGFIAGGTIDLQSIEMIASLDDANAVDPTLTFDPTIDPGLALDPSLGLDPSLDPSLVDPSLSGDPLLGGVTDPFTGQTSPVFASPAQLALFCLTSAVDWISLQECIGMNDRTIQLEAQ
jgi:hypothetical protein